MNMKRYMLPILFSKQIVRNMSGWTYMGGIGRENLEKISQSIYFDSEAAKFLVDILKDEFDI